MSDTPTPLIDRTSAPTAHKSEPVGGSKINDAVGAGQIPLWQAYLLAVVTLVAKAPDSLTLPQFWAEDATVFFAQQHGHKWPLLFTPYADYLNVISRLTAWIASFFSAVYAPTLYCYAAILIGAAGLASLRILGRMGMPYIVAISAIALLPTDGEVFGTITNTQWFMVFYLVALLVRIGLGQTTPPRDIFCRTLVIIPISLNGPFGVFATAAAVGTLFLKYIRTKRLNPPEPWPGLGVGLIIESSVMAVCSLIQLLIIYSSLQTRGVVGHRAGLVDLYSMIAHLQSHFYYFELFPGPLFVAIVSGVTIGAMTISWRRFHNGWLWSVIVLFGTLQFGAFTTKFSQHPFEIGGLTSDRYFLIPKVFFFWMVAILILGLFAQLRRPMIVVTTCLFGAFVLFILAAPPDRRFGVGRNRLIDTQWVKYARLIDANQTVEVPLNPVSWKMTIPAIDSMPAASDPDTRPH